MGQKQMYMYLQSQCLSIQSRISSPAWSFHSGEKYALMNICHSMLTVLFELGSQDQCSVAKKIDWVF